tara:strand:- start:509 stop:901 length:393 start_codon:yes stop_codon:yes gene_type:complete
MVSLYISIRSQVELPKRIVFLIDREFDYMPFHSARISEVGLNGIVYLWMHKLPRYQMIAITSFVAACDPQSRTSAIVLYTPIAGPNEERIVGLQEASRIWFGKELEALDESHVTFLGDHLWGRFGPKHMQ